MACITSDMLFRGDICSDFDSICRKIMYIYYLHIAIIINKFSNLQYLYDYED